MRLYVNKAGGDRLVFTVKIVKGNRKVLVNKKIDVWT